MQLVSAESETSRPIQNFGDQFVLADDPLATADQVKQKVEDFGLDRQQCIATTQLAPVGIERIFVEEIEQIRCSGLAAPNLSRRGQAKNDAAPRKGHDKAKLSAKRSFRRPGILTASDAGTSLRGPASRPAIFTRMEAPMAAGFRSITITGSAVLLYCAAVAFVPGILRWSAGSVVTHDNMKVSPGFGHNIVSSD